MLVSSYEKTKGRYLHAEELAALGFYMLQDETKGYLEWEEPCGERTDRGMKQLLRGLHFSQEVESHATFKSHFASCLSQAPSEFLDRQADTAPIYRWDLTRRIWLERGL